MSQAAPQPGWYPDPAGSGGVRWWDGVGWTDHLAMPEPEPEVEQVVYLDVARAPKAVKVDDGELHPRPKDDAFAGALRGTVRTPAERLKLDKDTLLSLQGVHLLGTIAFTLLCAAITVRGFLDPGGQWTGVKVGVAVSLGIASIVVIRIARRVIARNEFWLHWCASRGFEPGRADGPGRIMPGLLSRSPLLGPMEGRVFEHVARRRMAGREALVGSLLRVLAPPADAAFNATPETVRFAFALLPMPEPAAARWKGASIRADHMARRPLVLRAMLGPLVATSVPDCRSHVAIAADQDPAYLHQLFDARLERYLAARPMDVDIVDDLLVVTRDGDPYDEELLDELARDALLLHELLVAEHELPVERAPEPQVALPRDDEPVIDLTREGWGEGAEQRYEAA